MDVDWLKVAAIVEIVMAGCTILLGCAVFWLRHSFVKHKDFGEKISAVNMAVTASATTTAAAIETLRQRVSDCERKHEGTAKASDIAAINVRLAEINGAVTANTVEVTAMGKSFDRVSDAVVRVEDYLRENKL